MAQSPNAECVASLLAPVVERFCATLDAAAKARPKLTNRCGELAGWLRQFGDPADREVEPPASDEDMPF